MKKKKVRLTPYLLLLLPLTLVGTFSYYPFVKTIISAFSKTTEVGQWLGWADLENWKIVFNDKGFWQVIRNTVVFAAVVLTGSLTISITLALLADGCRGKGRRLIQTLYALPLVIASAPASLIWKFMYRGQGGILNALMGTEIEWLIQPNTALIAVAIVTAWGSSASGMILLLAGFKGVSDDLLEAATLDGAGPIMQAFKIKIPIASPQIFYVVFLKIITAFKAFAQIKLLTSGGPAGASTTLMYKIYERGTASGYFELACCYSILLFVIIFATTRIQFMMEKKLVHYQ